MPITSADIKYRLSGGAANADPLLSIGGAKSSVDASATIFDTVSGDESTAGDLEYRCVYVHNAHATLTMENAILWIQANTPSTSTTIDVSLGTSAINGVEQTVANENTAPAGMTWTAAANSGAAIALGNIPPGQSKAVWLRRTVTAAAPAIADSFTLRTQCDTAP